MAKKYKNILLVGATGLLGQAIEKELISRNYKFTAPSSDDLDVTDQEQIIEYFRHNWPDLVINCASVSDVDENEQDDDIWPELVNMYGPVVLSGLCADIGIPLVHFSSSYVFDGTATEPYGETAPAKPINRFGHYKIDADRIVARECPNALIVRTSWLFGPGRTNFISLVARKAQVGEPIEVPKEVISSPTYSLDLAEAVIDLLEHDARGIIHLSNSGFVSRYDLAVLVLELTNLQGAVNATQADLAYRAKRPAFSALCLDKAEEEFDITMRPWREALEEYIKNYLYADILLTDDIVEAEEI